MFKSITAATVAVSYVSAKHQLKCGPGFYPTLEGCKCVDQWAVPTGQQDVCACLDQTNNWNADGSFCGITNSVDLAAINSARTRFYPFDNAQSRLDAKKAQLDAWVAKQRSRAQDTRDAGFDVLPNPAQWEGHFKNFEPKFGWWVAPEEWFLGPWQWYGGVWEPYSPGNWYWNGNGWNPRVNLPWKYWGGEQFWYYRGWWYNYSKDLNDLKAEHVQAVKAIEAEHANRNQAISATAAAANNMIEQAYPLDAAVEATPWTTSIDNLAASTGAGYGMSDLEPQWLGKMNPFNNEDPLANGWNPTWPNNNRMPSTPPSLMNVPSILPQMP